VAVARQGYHAVLAELASHVSALSDLLKFARDGTMPNDTEALAWVQRQAAPQAHESDLATRNAELQAAVAGLYDGLILEPLTAEERATRATIADFIGEPQSGTAGDGLQQAFEAHARRPATGDFIAHSPVRAAAAGADGTESALPMSTRQDAAAERHTEAAVIELAEPTGVVREAADIAHAAHQMLPNGPTTPEQRMLAVTLASMKRLADNSVTLSKRVFANDFDSDAAALAASVTNVAVRNVAAVLIPTFTRQLLSYGLEQAFKKSHASDNTRALLATLTVMLPVLAHAIGGARDRGHGTQTWTSLRSRLIMGGLTLAALVAGSLTNVLSEVAPLVMAFTAYTFMRDVMVQSRLRLNNPNFGDRPNTAHWAFISAGYGIDQALVNAGMSQLASPSGPAAADGPGGIQLGNAATRAWINWAGEVSEDLMFQGYPAIEQVHPLRLSIEDVGYQLGQGAPLVKNALLAPWAVRSGILDMGLIGGTMIAKYLPGIDPASLEIATSAYIGLLNAILYEPFAEAGKDQPKPASGVMDPETGSAHELNVLPFPDFDISNRAAIRASMTTRSAVHTADVPDGGGAERGGGAGGAAHAAGALQQAGAPSRQPARASAASNLPVPPSPTVPSSGAGNADERPADEGRSTPLMINDQPQPHE
jgi:hypothetical protein